MAFIHFLTNLVAAGGKELSCLVNPKPHTRRVVYCDGSSVYSSRLTVYPVAWQHLKTGYSERTTCRQDADQASISSSSLRFAIECLNSSHLKGNLLFIDLRNRTVQRREIQHVDQTNSKSWISKLEKIKDAKRNAKDQAQAEIALLEKGCWQCRRFSAFASQCWNGLLRLLPVSVQLDCLLRSNKKQIERNKRDKEKGEKRLNKDDEVKGLKEKKATPKDEATSKDKATPKDKSKKNIGEERILEAKIVWLKDCQAIMHQGQRLNDTSCRQDMLKGLVDSLIQDGGAEACDTLDVCTVSFFMKVRSMSSIPSCSMPVNV